MMLATCSSAAPPIMACCPLQAWVDPAFATHPLFQVRGLPAVGLQLILMSLGTRRGLCIACPG